MTTLQKLRQAIYSYLQATKSPIKLSGLMAETKSKRRQAKAAVIALARKRLVKAEKIKEPWPCKPNPDRTIDSLEVTFIEPWSEKISPVNI